MNTDCSFLALADVYLNDFIHSSNQAEITRETVIVENSSEQIQKKIKVIVAQT